MKKWYKSKTVWFNVLTVVTGVIALAAASEDIIPGQYIKYALFAVAAINIVLRVFFTTESVEKTVA